MDPSHIACAVMLTLMLIFCIWLFRESPFTSPTRVALPGIVMTLAILLLLLVWVQLFPTPLMVFAVFGEVILALLGAFLNSLLKELSEAAAKHEEIIRLESQVRAQQQRRSTFAASTNQIDSMRAKFIQRIEDLQARIETESVEETTLRAGQAVEALRSGTPWCAHPIVDALVSSKDAECNSLGIDLRARLNIDQTTSLTDTELCAVFGNILDNAINACKTQTPEKRWIHLSCSHQAGYLIFTCINPYNVDRNHDSTTSPQDPFREHGWGLKILEHIARQHDGICKAEPAQDKPGVFVTSLMLKEVA